MPRAKMAALAAKAFLAASHLSHVFASGQLNTILAYLGTETPTGSCASGGMTK